MKYILIAVAAVLLVGGVWWYAKPAAAPTNEEATSTPEMEHENGDMMPNESATSTGEATGSAVTTPEGRVVELTVTGRSYAFSPTALTVKKGDRVRINYVNEGGTHDFVIDEFNARTQRHTGAATETIEFVADKAGTFEFYCSVGSHRQMGMVGTLVVTE